MMRPMICNMLLIYTTPSAELTVFLFSCSFVFFFLQVTAATFPEGGKVIYHEAVVYREDAICANAIIVYA